VAQKPGRFELADGGTLFLDEIGDITVNLQLKLLRVLQEREFERVGGTKTLKVDVRLIAATNRDLEAAVQAGAFREDLYYRLQVVQITLPPLRERQGDTPDLVHHFLDKFNKQNGRTATRVARKVMDLLKAYPWPGNVRELENAIERAVVLSDSASEGLEAELLPSAVTQYREGAVVGHSPGKKGRNGARPHLVSATLRRCGGDPAKAAAVLGMPVRSVRYYAEKYGLGHTEPVRNEKRKRRA
jgi:two-component system NtrC family response regulator/two-component system response regulator HydG